MKINKSKSSKKQIILSLIAVALIAGCGIAYYIYNQNRDEVNRDNTSGVKESQVKDNEGPSVSSDTDDPGSTTNPDKITSPGTKPSTDASIEAPTITRIEQTGANVRISTIFNSNTSGSCNLTLEKGGARITHTADIIVGPSYYTCNGFLVPTSELSPGTWSVLITHTYSGKTSTPTKGTVEIMK